MIQCMYRVNFMMEIEVPVVFLPDIEMYCIVSYSNEFGQILDAIGDMVDQLRPDPFIPAYWR